MLTLYFSPGAASFPAHIALEEAGLPFELQEVDLSRGQHRTPEYRAIHPLARVPALRTEDGQVLTEVSAILGYVADRVPERALLPTEPWARARAAEWMSLFGSSVHTAFISFFRPDRFTDAPEAQRALVRDGRARFLSLLQYVEQRLPASGFLLGDAYSLCDPYAVTFHLLARHFDFPMDTLPRYGALADRVFERPSFRAAFAREGLAKLSERRAQGAR